MCSRFGRPLLYFFYSHFERCWLLLHLLLDDIFGFDFDPYSFQSENRYFEDNMFLILHVVALGQLDLPVFKRYPAARSEAPRSRGANFILPRRDWISFRNLALSNLRELHKRTESSSDPAARFSFLDRVSE